VEIDVHLPVAIRVGQGDRVDVAIAGPRIGRELAIERAAAADPGLERGGRLLALSRQGARPYAQERFAVDDWLLFGRETDGLPQEVLQSCSQCLAIPMAGSIEHGGGVRSLNLSVSVGVVLFEALRQLES
jgi:tRNA(Leu) C34 or U34 (ribose-2'-O)-methylase TrmL